MTKEQEQRLEKAIRVLNVHHLHFLEAYPFAHDTKQPIPEDSRAWSQILVSVLTGIPGRARQKGSDLEDGSDVKAANAWSAIDKVRFNGVIKAGTQSELSDSMEYLDQLPYLFFVLWDVTPTKKKPRVRVWAVRPPYDREFRRIAAKWYEKRGWGEIKSSNFQLHPPVNGNKSNNTFTNRYGDLEYPLLLCAKWEAEKKSYIPYYYDPDVLDSGECVRAN